MQLKKCESGHYYDTDKYDNCPYCNNSIPVSSYPSNRENAEDNRIYCAVYYGPDYNRGGSKEKTESNKIKSFWIKVIRSLTGKKNKL